MVSARLLLPALCVIGTLLSGFSPQANAQATRTWVSGVGDDANPASRTAPCKTFAGAISKTAAGGVINVLDPGGFGAVVITKSITIDGTGTMAGILANSSANGVIINAPGKIVVLRELIFEGTGTGVSGVQIIDAAKVYLERCTISGFQNGILIGAAGQVVIKDCTIQNCVAGVVLGEGGTATLMGSTITQNGTGLSSEGSMFVGNSLITGNTGAGLSAVKPGFIRSLKGNQLVDNTPDGKFSKSIPQR